MKLIGELYCTVRPVGIAPKGREAVARVREPQVRANPSHTRSFSIFWSQAPEWGRQGRASNQPFERQRTVANGFAAVSLLRSSVFKKSIRVCGPRPRTWGLRHQATTCRRIRGFHPGVDRRTFLFVAPERASPPIEDKRWRALLPYVEVHHPWHAGLNDCWLDYSLLA